MKKLLIIAGVLVLSIVAFAFISESSNKKAAPQKVASAAPAATSEQATAKEGVDQETAQPQKRPVQMDHSGKINCKTCHACEYPTKENPCLVACPKNSISVHHSPEQAPEVLVLNSLTEKYGSVVFSHKVHAQMSEMSHGCSGCHHYNTTGPILSCKKCHETARKRENIGTPDLEAAYHRQCMPCHRKWSKSTGCDSCHQLKSAAGSPSQKDKISKVSGKVHPRSSEPTRIVYDTGSSTGRYVTFYHNEHVAKFNLSCTGCHKDEKCMKCHEVKSAPGTAAKMEKHSNGKKDFGSRHKVCAGCHDTRKCVSCHGEAVKQPFQHAVNAGWDLGKHHTRLSCDRCHGKQNPVRKVDSKCTSCHSWKLGSFNHAITGLTLSKNHQEINCESCHAGKDFSKKPVCKECHDDKEYPKALPGERKGEKKGKMSIAKK